ncbi:hypothetical protein C8R43DRAFT_1043164 [Mycena crocata]|nr:hypothetical protein C8R43DRAFT_1043164 [Mycena crocata]
MEGDAAHAWTVDGEYLEVPGGYGYGYGHAEPLLREEGRGSADMAEALVGGGGGGGSVSVSRATSAESGDAASSVMRQSVTSSMRHSGQSGDLISFVDGDQIVLSGKSGMELTPPMSLSMVMAGAGGGTPGSGSSASAGSSAPATGLVSRSSLLNPPAPASTTRSLAPEWEGWSPSVSLPALLASSQTQTQHQNQNQNQTNPLLPTSTPQENPFAISTSTPEADPFADPLPPPPPLPSTVLDGDGADTSPRDSLLRPSLSVLRTHSSRTLDDHVDYSRAIGAVRLGSANTLESMQSRAEGEGNA